LSPPELCVPDPNILSQVGARGSERSKKKKLSLTGQIQRNKKISDVRCQMADLRCQISDVRCQRSEVRSQMSEVKKKIMGNGPGCICKGATSRC
jgi:hypothetical protein